MKYDVFIKNKELSKKAPEAKNLMSGLYVYSDLVPKGCHNGACGVCKIKVHAGEFSKDKMNRKHISELEEVENIVLACKCYPKSNMEIEFLQKIKSKPKQTEKKVYVFGS